MQSNRPRTTKPETTLRAALHREGLRFRKHLRPVRGSRQEVDIAFTRVKLAVFVDGCFWHGCPAHATFPVTNQAWWAAKLANNRERDRRFNELLKQDGWTVMRLWEHESTADALGRVQGALALLDAAPTAPPATKHHGARDASIAKA